MRIESRIATGLVNPYLSLAVHIAAGLDGVRKKMPLPKEGQKIEMLPRFVFRFMFSSVWTEK